MRANYKAIPASGMCPLPKMILDFRFRRLGIILSSVALIYFLYSLYLARGGFVTTLSNERKLMVYEKMIVALRNRQGKCGGDDDVYCKRPETQHIDCGRVLRGDKSYIKSISGANRIPIIEDPHLNMSCEAIKTRISSSSSRLKPLKSGVAFARIVYMDYEFLEKQVQMSFHPQNVFCFAVDRNAPEEFHRKMKALGECLENVIVLPATEHYDSDGHNNNLGLYRCMEALLPFTTWNYLLLLQNHDVVTKSVYELARIFEILGGANDAGVGEERKGRRKKGLRWDPKSLKLFRNETGVPEHVLNTPMTFSTGYLQASVSRAAVEWMVKTVDLTTFINQWNYTDYGSDEQFFSSLHANPQLGMPGHFTYECQRQGFGLDQITRMTQWNVGDPKSCATGAFRHDICIMGIENLKGVAKWPTLMFNKMIPSFDYSIIECTAELLHNRTFLGQMDHELDESYYGNMINVLYHKHHLEPDYSLNCTPSYKTWTLPMEM